VAFPWFATAGYTRGLINATKVRKNLTQDDRDDLYEARINPIANFTATGPVIWGNKTLQTTVSALDRINVRRLMLRARKLISAVAVRLVFEQNDEVVRQEFLSLVNPILDDIRRDRGLTDFKVVVSSDPEEIDQNKLTGKIYLKPTRSLEFIEIEFNITPTATSFDDI
jgi:phage tail sheath protein FI